MTKIMLLCIHYQELGIVSQVMQEVNLPFWKRSEAIKRYMKKLATMTEERLPVLKKPRLSESSRDAAPTMGIDDIKQGEFATLPLFLKGEGPIIPLRQTRGMTSE